MDRHICRLFIGYFFATLLALLTLVIAVDSLSKAFSYDVSFDVLFRFYVYMSPSVMYQMFPVAAMSATIFTLSYMNKNNELIALFSFGTSLIRVSAPILGLVAIFSMLAFVADDLILPTLNKKKDYVFYMEMKKTPEQYATVRKNKIWYRSKNNLFYVRALGEKLRAAQGLTLYSFGPNWKLLKMITAKEVDMNEANWHLRHGTVTLFTGGSSFPLTQDFVEKDIVMDVVINDLQGNAQPLNTLGLEEIRKFIKKNKEAGLNTVLYEMDYQAKFSFAFAALVMSFLGLPFCVNHQRSGGGMRGLGVSIGLAFIYWSCYSSSLALGRHGEMEPVLAAWLPNVGMSALGLFLFLRLKK